MSFSHRILAVALLAGAPAVHAQALPDSARRAPRDTVARLGGVTVTGTAESRAARPPLQRLTLPATASVTAARAQLTVNLVDAEDAVRYLPSVFLRKRNNGDTQATLGTRVWGVSSSARSLVFADGVPLSALIANNNNIGGPRWGLVSPDEIERVDVMYGPFSAAYAGNSMGAVMELTTRMPDSLTWSLGHTQALQRFAQYGTRDAYATAQTSGSAGTRVGRLAVRASATLLTSESQPLSYVTAGAFPPGTTGGYEARNKIGGAANVLGASGLLHARSTNATLKAAYDLSPTLRATYTLGLWRNEGHAGVETYLDSAGRATFARQAGFASGFYDVEQRHSSHSLALRTNRRGDWDAEAVATRYRFDADRQRLPVATGADTSFGPAGRAVLLDGTGWTTLDLKGAWHRGGALARHTVTAGLHADAYRLRNPTYATSDWRAGADAYTGVASEGDGRTRTRALWAQDAWRITDRVMLTAGLRHEGWRALDGFNAAGSTRVTQPVRDAARWSPKAIVTYAASPDLTLTASVGRAYRFATAAELYQLVTTGASFTAPDPDLRPDAVLATELRAVRAFDRGSVQLALFQDDVHDAIIAQFLPLVAGSPTLYSYLANVDHVRARGAELSAGGADLWGRSVDLSGSVTFVDARTLAISGRASATAPEGSAVGRRLPNIPRWRGSATAAWRATPRLALSLAGRYSGMVFTTLDNADVNPNTWQGFGEWFVADAKASWRFDRRWSASVGVDNLLDREYFVFHPFPRRTLVASARVAR